MSFDIYGNNLRPGHCEVHPHVHEEYPCSVCLAESASRRDTHSRADICDGNPSRCESAHMLGQALQELDRLKAVLSGMQEMAKRFYAGDIKAVDEFLQRYDLADEWKKEP